MNDHRRHPDSDHAPAATSGWRSMLRALAHRNFRLYFGGQGISLIGTWMQQTAMVWLVFRLTNDPLWLGIVGFAGQIPSFFLAPLAGVITDRWNRHRLLLLTQTLAMLQAFIMAGLTWAGMTPIWSIVLLSLFLGVVNAFDMTVRQAFLLEMIERRQDLGNAIALNSSLVNGARLIGPSLGGLLIAWVGEAVCFLLNGLSYLAVLAALLAMRLTAHRTAPHQQRVWHGLLEGIRYTFGFAPIRAILLLLALVSMTGLSYTVLLPVYAADTLHGGADTLGFLMAASGVGALLGAIYLAARKTILGLGVRIALAPAVFGTGLIAFACSRWYAWSLFLLGVTGFAMMVHMAASNTILQTIADEDKRGRVMSFYTVAFMGMAPLGSLLMGDLASRLGVTQTLIIGGLSCIAGAVLFGAGLPALRAQVRPVYVRIGILPQVAAGIQSATDLRIPPAH